MLNYSFIPYSLLQNHIFNKTINLLVVNKVK